MRPIPTDPVEKHRYEVTLKALSGALLVANSKRDGAKRMAAEAMKLVDDAKVDVAKYEVLLSSAKKSVREATEMGNLPDPVHVELLLDPTVVERRLSRRYAEASIRNSQADVQWNVARLRALQLSDFLECGDLPDVDIKIAELPRILTPPEP